MKLLLVTALLSLCAAAPPKQRMILPRYPISVLMNGKFQLIPDDKIVGGQVVEPNSLPFQISLQRRSFSGTFSQSCGGSILTANTILNAAHCVEGIVDTSIFRVVAGEHDLTVTSGLEQNRGVTSYKMHENWDTRTDENDIALLYLDAPLDLSVPSAKAVNLPPAFDELAAGTIVTVSGWGTTSYGGSISNQLRSVDLPIVSDSECNAALAGVFDPQPIFATNLCAGDMSNGGVDTCQGDSGGPLFIGTGADAVQHGITSWGRSCASAGLPGVYTQVSYYIDWISANQL